MSNKLNSNCKVFVKAFSVAKTTCMDDYVKLSLRSSLNNFILHVGTNGTKYSRMDQVKFVEDSLQIFKGCFP